MRLHGYTQISIDIESDGPVPGLYSMVSLGAVAVEPPDFPNRFYTEIAPISDNYDTEALNVNGFKREETLAFPKPELVIPDFAKWVQQFPNPRFISDNAGFDWMYVAWYLWKYYGRNPFGHSSLSITSFWKGLDRDLFSSFKHLRKTKHSHNALDDALGNAEAFVKMLEIMKHGR